MRIILWITLSLLLTLLGVGGIFLASVFTESGTRFLIHSIEKMIPGKLTILQIDGKLASSIHLRGINYFYRDISVSLDAIDLSWSSTALLRKKLKIYTFSANKISIHLPKNEHSSSQKNPSFPSIGWLRLVDLARLDLKEVEIYQQKNLVLHIYDVNLQKKPEGQVVVLDGLLGSYPIHGLSYLDFRQESILIKKTQIRIGDAFFNLSGTIKKNPDLKWEINIPHLNTLSAAVKGSVVGAGIINESGAEGKFKLNDIRLTYQPNYILTNTNLMAKVNLTNLVTEANLSGGNILFKKLGVSINLIDLQGKYSAEHILNFHGKFKSNEELVNISGKFAPTQVGSPLELMVSGKNIRVINLPEYKINLSPNINLLYSTEQLIIKGEMQVPWARIKPKDLSSVITLPSEVVFVDKPAVSENKLSNLSATLQIELGRDVLVNYQNLHANLGGQLTVTQTPQGVATAVGELYTIKGKYRAYDRLLKIKSGRLIYTGNALNNPGLDIRAIKEIQTKGFTEGQTTFSGADAKIKHAYTGSKNITVGVWVKGTLEKPQISLFSDPPGLVPTDILSYIVFGYPQSQINQASSLSLLTALASNANKSKSGGVSQVLAKTEKLKKKLGITEFGVGSTEIYDPSKETTENKTTFTVGKKIGDKVHLKYSVGIFSPIQVLNLTFQLTKRLAIQSETSSVETGADILYEFEKD